MMRTLPLILAAGLLLAGPAHGLNDGLGEPPSDVDRSTPLATVQGFQASAHKGDYATAAHYLALDWVPKDRQKAEGARLARRLRFVMDRKLFLDLGAISKEPEGDPSKPGFDQLGTLQLENRKIPIRVSKFTVDGKPTWVFSTITVRNIDALYDAFGPPLGELLPEVFFSKTVGDLELWQWLGLMIAFVVALVGGWLLERLGLVIIGQVTRMTRVSWDDQLVQAARGPLRLPIWALVLSIVTPPLLLPPVWAHGISVLSRSLLVISAAWFALRFLDLASGVVESRVAKAHENVANARAVGESENGTVEEISLTYVVIRTWDLRRMLVPVTQFLEKPFQNWSKGGVEMLGTVLLNVDWTTDIEAVRKELGRILAEEGKGFWDGKLAKVQVVDSTEQTMQLRILLGGYVDTLFELRSLVRERLIAFVHRTPAWLPKQRMEHDGNPAAAPAPRQGG